MRCSCIFSKMPFLRPVQAFWNHYGLYSIAFSVCSALLKTSELVRPSRWQQYTPNTHPYLRSWFRGGFTFSSLHSCRGCAIAISSNLLAVTLSILFSEAPTLVTINMTSTLNLGTTFNGSIEISFGITTAPITYSDHYHIIMSNLIEGTSLPPWIDNKFFYILIDIPSTLPDYALLVSRQSRSGKLYRQNSRFWSNHNLSIPPAECQRYWRYISAEQL